VKEQLNGRYVNEEDCAWSVALKLVIPFVLLFTCADTCQVMQVEKY